MKIEIVPFGYFEVFATIEMLEACNHSGPCDEDVAYYLPQFIKLNPDLDNDKLKKELRDYGAWNDKELSNHEDNLSRILWIAAGNWQEEQFNSNKIGE